jgi:hypothetical protein
LGTVIKYHHLGDLNNRTVYSLSSRGWNSMVKMPDDSVLDEDLLLGLQRAVVLPYLA